MPLEIADFSILEEYINSAPSARIYYRVEGKKMVVVAGMLSWRGTIKDADTFQTYKDFLEAHNAIEVNGWSDIRELFA